MSKATASGALGLAFASALGWLCCLPIASGAFGIALAALAAAVGPWWPVLAFASLVLLVVAIVQTLRGGGGPRSDHCEHAKPRPAAMALRQHRRCVDARTPYLPLVEWRAHLSANSVKASMRRILLLMALLLCAAVLTRRAMQAGQLRDLRDLEELRTLVDHDKSVPRLVLLLSPT